MNKRQEDKMTALVGTSNVFYWVILPIVLLASVLLRYNALSAIYLLFLLFIPFTPRLTPATGSSWKACSLTVAIVSGIFILGHVGFQITLLATSPYGSLVGSGCSTAESIARYAGFQRLDVVDVGNIFRLLIPDVLVFIVSLVTYIVVKKATDHLNNMAVQQELEEQQVSAQQHKTLIYLRNATVMCFTVLFMGLAGIAYPSVVSAIYFLVFLALLFVWAFNQPLLTPSVAALRAAMCVITSLQLLFLYIYQMAFMQHYIVSTSLYARLFGVTPIIKTNCAATYQLLVYANIKWTVFVSPACIFTLHWLMAIGVRMFYSDQQILSNTQVSSPENGVTAHRPRKSNDEKKAALDGREDYVAAVQPLVQSEEQPQNYDTMEQIEKTVHGEPELEEIDGEGLPKKDTTLQKMSKVLAEVKMYSFYVVALIIMMLWSVTYHSWLTFVLLIGACILWMTNDRSKITLMCSPAIAVYGLLLVLLQFIYSLDLNESELPTKINQTDAQNQTTVLDLAAFGLRHYAIPCLPLGAQVLYLCGFILVLHQFVYIRKHGGSRGEVGQASGSTWTDKMASWLMGLFCKYWIFLVVGFHIAICTEGYPTGIKVIYMAFFLLNIVTYTVSWLVWRKTLTLYWTVLVAYTMIVLIVVYTYQFKSFPGYWRSFTHFNDTQLADLGLVQYTTAGELLIMILLPALFLLMVVLQLHYFNARFLELTGKPQQISCSPDGSVHSGERVDGDNFEMNELNRGMSVVKEEQPKKGWFSRFCDKAWKFLKSSFSELSSFALRALEFHTWRLVFITVFAAAAHQVSVIYAILVVAWVCLLPARKTHTPLYVLTTLYVSLVMLGTMFYQLQFINLNQNLQYTCIFNSKGAVVNSTSNLLDWIGFVRMPQSAIFFYHVEGYLAIILMIALERTIARRQEWRRLWRNEPLPPITAFYPSITHKEVDNGLLECFKFFLNYFFYKFGVEACFVMTVVTVWVRMDIYATLYALLLIISMSIRTRLVLSRYWRFYIIVLIALLVAQYLICLGMPPSWCTSNKYPWEIWANSTQGSRLIRWLYLPDYVIVPISTSLIADFFQLLFFTSQLFVFERETSVWMKYGGDNRYLTGRDLDNATIASNPKKSFLMRKSRSLLDQLKTFLFKYMIWITMAFIFFAGSTRISLFCLGYLISFFYLLSRQQQIITGKASDMLKIWNIILGYNVAVITLKASLQIASCVYIDTLRQKACAFVQLMSLVCSYPAGYSLTIPTVANPGTCELSYVNAGLTWDFICFLFLLMQRRIFTSYYFWHVSNDMKASLKLAARGAELFGDKLIEEVRERERLEEEELGVIIKSMRDLKARYSAVTKWMKSITSHTDAIRAGDYYMFEEDDGRKDPSMAPEEIMGPIKMLHKVGTVGLDETLKEREADKLKLEETGETDKKEVEDPKDTEDAVDAADVVVDEATDKEDKTTDPKEVELKVENEEEQEQEQEEEKPPSVLVKIKKGATFCLELFLSGVDYLALKLNEFNQDYRNISLQLSAEKDQLSEELCSLEPKASNSDVAIVVEDGEAASKDASPAKSSTDSVWVDLQPIEFDKDQHRVLRFFYALWYLIISHTDLVCYFLFVLSLMLNASMLSLVLPLAVFLWACFCIPRPTKTFWTFVLVYLQVIIVIKFIFQFELFPWNSQAQTNLNKNDPFWPPRFLGIEQKSSWMVMELLQLLAVFFHISILKVHGLWDKSDKLEEQCQEEEVEEEATEEPTTSQQATLIAKQESTKGEKKKKKSFANRVYNQCKRPFIHLASILHQRFTSVTDIYIYMFLCDVINFIIIIFGYWAFGAYSTQQANVVSNLQSNRVPSGFLAMLLIQFSMMFIDRALYLRKNLLGKLIFQIILVIGIHVWMFFILPLINQRPFYQNYVAQIWYFFKALYFLLSAYQIRVGYPNRVCGNFLTKSFGTANLFLFKGYRAIPFLAELTAIMNWMYTETTMGMGEWMKLSSIHAEVFELKCWRVFEKEYPSPRGAAKQIWLKYLIGGLLVFILLFIIWFPLLLMNLVTTFAGVTNNPIQVDVKITLGTFEPLFQVAADTTQIFPMTANQFTTFQKQFANNPAAASFLTGFSNNEVVNVQIDGQSKTKWIISPPQRQLLAARLLPNNTNPVRLMFDWTLTKDSSKTTVASAVGSNTLSLASNSVARKNLYELLVGNNTNITAATVFNLYPQYIYSPATSSKALAATSLYLTNPVSNSYLNVSLALRTDPANPTTSWWSVFETNSAAVQLPMVILSDKVSPSSLNFLVSYGIIGLYVSVVLVVGKLVRSMFWGSTSTIMFLELPCVDRILQLCDDIFLVREEAEFELEEDLFAKLIFLYRSPKLLIRWTRPKQD
uniref:Piezo-type mechanosensitive ion channel component 2-like n=1 Tax=Phallusia mammillata TaxID=59560 RepID=A0A6F9DPN4_9ASCI|nr:piezo-type mechanosensitive ion channel component 2-like [Phallusia mammillata]